MSKEYTPGLPFQWRVVGAGVKSVAGDQSSTRFNFDSVMDDDSVTQVQTAPTTPDKQIPSTPSRLGKLFRRETKSATPQKVPNVWGIISRHFIFLF